MNPSGNADLCTAANPKGLESRRCNLMAIEINTLGHRVLDFGEYLWPMGDKKQLKIAVKESVDHIGQAFYVSAYLLNGDLSIKVLECVRDLHKLKLMLHDVNQKMTETFSSIDVVDLLLASAAY